MKFFRLDLLTLLISLFILNSCKNQSSIGLLSNSSVPVNGGLVDTSTIITNTVLDDTVATSGASKNPLGYFNDPVFGITQSDLATDINLPGQSSYSLPYGTITVDSALLVLKFADGFYGDSLQSTYKVNVYQLAETFISGQTYYNNKVWKYNPNFLLGTATFNSRTHTPIKIYNIITGAPDTLHKVQPQVRIPINLAFINSIFFNASNTILNSNAVFQNTVKGLYITIDKANSKGRGGIFMIKPADSLAIYYRAVNSTATDTNQVYLPITAIAAQISHSYPLAIQSEINNTSSSRGTIYLQGLAGLRAKVSFPNLLLNLRNNLLKKDSDIIINRAEIVISALPGSNIPFTPSPKLTMYRFDLAHQRSYLEDATSADPRYGGVGVFGGYYIASTQTYHFIVTAFLQDLLFNKTVDYGTYISVVDTVNAAAVDINATPQAAGRTIAGGGANKSSPYNIKLNVIYTKVRKSK